jgi:hypothetical protein
LDLTKALTVTAISLDSAGAKHMNVPGMLASIFKFCLDLVNRAFQAVSTVLALNQNVVRELKSMLSCLGM